MKVIDLKTALELKQAIFIDVRTPAEYEEGHITGAVNIPLLSNNERAEIGIIHKNEGSDEAKKRGLEIVSTKLPILVAQVKEAARNSKETVVYCWRGGMRSKSLVGILDIMGIKALQLSGGYKVYRRFVLEELKNFEVAPEIMVLCGSTGVGKTMILERLTQKGICVIDMEGMANHRGSAFGHVGMGKPATAQAFDAELLSALKAGNEQMYMFVECESKRIGNVYIPDALFKAMRTGVKILLKADINVRIRRLIGEYTDSATKNINEIKGCIEALRTKLGNRKTDSLHQELLQGNFEQVAHVLLKDYYDPLYGYEVAEKNNFAAVIDTGNPERAVADIEDFLVQWRSEKCKH